MANPDVSLQAQETAALPHIRTIGPADLKAALASGIDDFRAMATTHVIFLSLIYSIIGLILARAAFGYDLVPLLFPLAAGFALIGPIAAIWLYELSRRREQGLDVAWYHAFDVVRSPSAGAIVVLGLMLLVLFSVWVAIAQAIYIANFGYQAPASIGQFIRDVFTTRAGWTMILVGNAVGFIFALVAFALSVVSFPLLIDRNVGVSAAIATSVGVVAKNPVTMAMWGLIVAAALVIGSIPGFLGLAIVMPVLGHATWHLYRRAVERDSAPPIQYRPPAPGHRSAADFPVSLFTKSRDEK